MHKPLQSQVEKWLHFGWFLIHALVTTGNKQSKRRTAFEWGDFNCNLFAQQQPIESTTNAGILCCDLYNQWKCNNFDSHSSKWQWSRWQPAAIILLRHQHFTQPVKIKLDFKSFPPPRGDKIFRQMQKISIRIKNNFC